MKGCLKHCSTPSHGLECHRRKFVAFGAEGSEEIHVADEWDRTPTEPARTLSYQEILELKEIQQSLPQANQPPDPLSRRIYPHYLSAVPLPLLPLLAPSDTDGDYCHPFSPPESPKRRSSPASPTPRSAESVFAPQQPSTPPPTTQAQQFVDLSHLSPAQPVPLRPKQTFAFLPLLDTPPMSAQSSPYPSTSNSRNASPDIRDQPPRSPTPSLTTTSIESSPSHTSTSSPDLPAFVQSHPSHNRAFHHDNQNSKPLYGAHKSYFPPFSEHYRFDSPISHPLPPAVRAIKLEASASPSLLPPSPLSLSPTPTSSKNSNDGNVLRHAKPIRRRNVILVNGMEVEVDGDDNTEVPTPSPPKRTRRRQIIIVNDVEVEVDADNDEDSSEATPPTSPPVSFEPPPEPEPAPAPTSVPQASSPSKTPSPPPRPSSLEQKRVSGTVSEHRVDQPSSPTSASTSPIKSLLQSSRVQRATRDLSQSSPLSMPCCMRGRPNPSSPVMVPSL